MFVYDLGNEGKLKGVFEGHGTTTVTDLVQLDGDLVASVSDSRLCSWRAINTKLVDKWIAKKNAENFVDRWRIPKKNALLTLLIDSMLTSVAKLNDEKLIVGDNAGNIIVLWHKSTSKFQVIKRIVDSHKGGINEIKVRNGLIVTSSNDETENIWDIDSFSLLHTIRHESSGVRSYSSPPRKLLFHRAKFSSGSVHTSVVL